VVYAPVRDRERPATARVTPRFELMTNVTCPIKRYHAAVVVAQKAATVSLLSDGRFALGPGRAQTSTSMRPAGGWPPLNVRHRMLDEPIDITRTLWAGGCVTFDGRSFQVDSARLRDLSDHPSRLRIAASGPQSGTAGGTKGRLSDRGRAVRGHSARLRGAGGNTKPRVG
jgi:alkanesulfonate monooxygenase SsuD/methylene tetrahydromethanopterin reductase-like flavin-dependent oxidoreductase (luciferase family)